MKNHSSDMKNDMKRKMHPNSLKNLKPLKKGDVINPLGKKKGTLDEVTKIKDLFGVMHRKMYRKGRDMMR